MGHRERKRARLIEQFVPPAWSNSLDAGWRKAAAESRVHWKYQYSVSERTHNACTIAFKTATQSDKLKLMKLFEYVLRESVKARLK